MDLLKKLNWTNTLFLIFTPLIGLIGAGWWLTHGLSSWMTWGFAFTYMMITGLSVTGGYHRLFSHKSYKASRLVRGVFLLFATATFEGSALEWCTDHRNHHLYTDTDRDPYNIKKGFWYAHIGWLFMLDANKRDFSNVKDLMADPWVRFQHRFFVPLAVLTGFGFPTMIALLWGDPWGGFLIAGALRIAINHHLTFLINSLCHYMGKRTYSDRQTARDHWITAIFTYGEGFHNFHHQFPLDYRNGVRAYHFDPTKWLIGSLAGLGLVSDLKRVGAHRILRYKIRMDEQRLLCKTAETSRLAAGSFMKDVIRPVREGITHVLNRIEALEKEYLALRALRRNNHADRRVRALKKYAWREYRARLMVYRKRLKAAHQELQAYMILWSRLVKQQRLGSSEGISMI